MSKYIPGNQKHLTLNDRIYIENELAKETSFKDITAFLCKDPTTISKEVRAHRISDWYHKGTFYNSKNFCIHRYHYKKTNACVKILLCGIKCTSCPTSIICNRFHKICNCITHEYPLYLIKHQNVPSSFNQHAIAPSRTLSLSLAKHFFSISFLSLADTQSR